MWALVKEQEVIRLTSTLPMGGSLPDGRLVSPLRNLSRETLGTMGWFPVRREFPDVNPDTHNVRFKEYQVRENEVVAVYEAVEKPGPEEREPDEQEPDSEEQLRRERIALLRGSLFSDVESAYVEFIEKESRFDDDPRLRALEREALRRDGRTLSLLLELLDLLVRLEELHLTNNGEAEP